MPAVTASRTMPSRETEQLQLITFEVNRLECAIDILSVREITQLGALTPIPNAGPCIEGAMTLKGDVIPVVNLRARLALPRLAADADTRMIIVEVHGRPIGFIVDRMHDTLRISREVVDTAPAMPCGIDPDFTAGVGRFDNRSLILLDLEQVFANETAAARTT